MRRLTLPEDEFVRLYADGYSAARIGSLFDISNATVSSRLKARGVWTSRRNRTRNYSINDHAFDDWTDAAAYWAGFIMADGCVYYRPIDSAFRPQIKVQLQERDAGHLRKLALFLSCDKVLRTVKRKSPHSESQYSYVTLSVYSQQIASQLEQVGIVPRKSLIACVSLLNDNRHFWRGVVDGDGSLTYCGGTPSIYLIGSESLMRQYAAFCDSVSGATPSIGRHKGSEAYWAYLSGKRAVSMVRHLYIPCDVALDRKMARALAMERHYQ